MFSNDFIEQHKNSTLLDIVKARLQEIEAERTKQAQPEETGQLDLFKNSETGA